ncbi:hypothetical protein PoB_003284400 [Plakobranchus ocellatus]|uniref:Uncharacterized protein n=1 Tax=Plakobranchus ocellatus TaxID=259542 RepID=A0AAV4AIT8_9GAST|nr:hypothetical protein PoB_003284400 [Plakobranchus ocellatus]
MDGVNWGYKGHFGELRDLVIRDQLYRSLYNKIAISLKERGPKSVTDVRDMAANYRSAYPDISLAWEEIFIVNVAAGPTGKDRDARPTVKDDWDAKDRGCPMYRRSQSSGPPRRRWATGFCREQSRQDWRYCTDKTGIFVVEDDCQTR